MPRRSRRPPLPSLQPGPDGYSVLPPARYTCTRRQFERKFVRGNRFREELVEDLDIYRRQQAKRGLVVSAYWVGGSFVSDKDQPGDIDFTALIDGAASTPDPAAIRDWTNPGKKWARQIHPDVGRLLRLDAYGIVKYPDGDPRLQSYHELRGYWDDWWQRSRKTGQSLSRGYLEVVDW
ncbi:DUF6932 family protein [Mycolicibacterium hippocampi]